MFLKDAPIRRKLMTIILMTSGAVLLLTCSAFVTYEVVTFRQTMVRQISTLGEIVAANSTASLAFDNQDDAKEILAALRAEQHIVAAALYDQNGNLFSSYPVDHSPESFPAAPEADGYRFSPTHLTAVLPVVEGGGKRLGTLYLRSDMGAMYERFQLYGIVVALVIAVSFLVAYVLSLFLQKQISHPILSLAETAKAISENRDYSVRATKHGQDELGLLTDAFNQMLAQIEAVTKELESFCYSVSHDLRAPLRGIEGYSRLLLQDHSEKLDEEGRLFVDNVRSGVQQMGALIEDLLAYSRMERRDLQNKPIDIQPLVQKVLTEYAKDMQAGSVELRLDLPTLTARADPEGLAVVLRNLLGNAIKFSRDAVPPIIEIGGKRKGKAAILWIRDNGIGFDMKFHDRIFEIFQRLQRAEDYPGTGVGLAMARKAVQRMNGRIWAESSPGHGATFFVELPA